MAIPTGIQEKIDNTALAAAAAAVPGSFLPIIDIAAMSVLWTNMINDIGEELGHIDREGASKKFVLSLLKGASLYLAGSRLFSMFITWTGIGAVGTVSLNAALNYIYTQRLGKHVFNSYSRPGFKFSDFTGLSIAGLVFAEVPDVELETVTGVMEQAGNGSELVDESYMIETLDDDDLPEEVSTGTGPSVRFGGSLPHVSTAEMALQQASADELSSYLANALEYADNNPIKDDVLDRLENALDGGKQDMQEALMRFSKAVEPGTLKKVLPLTGIRFRGSSA